MTLVLFMVLAVGATYWLATVYITRSMRSYRNAEVVWSQMDQALRSFISKKPPVAVAQLAIGLANASGCGCFVRGVVMTHYLPRLLARTASERAVPIETAFKEAKSMPAEEQAEFDRLVGLVIIFDSYSNPAQGWVFRHIMKSFTQPEQTWNAQMETKLAAFSVMSNRALAVH